MLAWKAYPLIAVCILQFRICGATELSVTELSVSSVRTLVAKKFNNSVETRYENQRFEFERGRIPFFLRDQLWQKISRAKAEIQVPVASLESEVELLEGEVESTVNAYSQTFSAKQTTLLFTQDHTPKKGYVISQITLSVQTEKGEEILSLSEPSLRLQKNGRSWRLALADDEARAVRQRISAEGLLSQTLHVHVRLKLKSWLKPNLNLDLSLKDSARLMGWPRGPLARALERCDRYFTKGTLSPASDI